jgi:peptide/nickel transport system permease protein
VTRFLLRRLAQAVPLLLLVSLGVFALLHALPGGPLDLYLANPNVRPEDVERLRRSLGLDRPLAVQYVTWLAGFLRGEWGFSYTDGRPVATRLFERLPASIELVGTSLVVAALAALPAGVWAAVYRRRAFDRVSAVAAAVAVSMPVFWLGLLLQIVFALRLGWLPSAGRTSFGVDSFADRLQHLVLPATVLASVHAAIWSRYLRATLGETLERPFIAAARARGLAERTLVWSRALRPAAPAVLTVALLDAAMVVSGAVVTESVFAWPGVGSLFTEALARRDYTVLMAFLMLSATVVVLANFVADACAAWLDPRMRA